MCFDVSGSTALRLFWRRAYPALDLGTGAAEASAENRAADTSAKTYSLEDLLTSMQPNHDDAELVRLMARGDKKALSGLYDRYAGLLLGLAVRMMGGRSEAEDLMHDVFLEAWKRAGDYDPARGTVKAWLCLRIRSRALDRKKSPRVARAVAWDDARANETEAPAQDPGLRMERARVREALTTLSAEQRDVVDLCYFNGFSTSEAAEQLQCPVGTVKSRLSAARDRLRTALTVVEERRA